MLDIAKLRKEGYITTSIPNEKLENKTIDELRRMGVITHVFVPNYEIEVVEKIVDTLKVEDTPKVKTTETKKTPKNVIEEKSTEKVEIEEMKEPDEAPEISEE